MQLVHITFECCVSKLCEHGWFLNFFDKAVILPSSYSTLGRIIKVSPEVLAYRDWTIKNWGAKQLAKLESHGNFRASRWTVQSKHFKLNVFSLVVFCSILDVDACEQDLARLMLVEEQRDTSSPLSADSLSPSPVFLPSPQHHSSSSSACSLSSSSGSDIVRSTNISFLALCMKRSTAKVHFHVYFSRSQILLKAAVLLSSFTLSPWPQFIRWFRWPHVQQALSTPLARFVWCFILFSLLYLDEVKSVF